MDNRDFIINDNSNVNDAVEKLNNDLEMLTLRGMKEAVAEYLSSLCFVDFVLKDCILDKEKNLNNCLKYVTEKAKEHLRESSEAFEVNGGFGGDVPNELCFKWAVKYYKTSNDELYPKKVYTPPVKKDEKKESKKNEKSEDLMQGLM